MQRSKNKEPEAYPIRFGNALKKAPEKFCLSEGSFARTDLEESWKYQRYMQTQWCDFLWALGNRPEHPMTRVIQVWKPRTKIKRFGDEYYLFVTWKLRLYGQNEAIYDSLIKAGVRDD
jgi:hypothetical protein